MPARIAAAPHVAGTDAPAHAQALSWRQDEAKGLHRQAQAQGFPKPGCAATGAPPAAVARSSCPGASDTVT